MMKDKEEVFKYKFSDLFNPVLEALHSLGGSATVNEIEDFVIEKLNLSEEEISDIHRGTSTKLNYRLRWARNYLKNYSLLENSSRGIWALTPKGLITSKADPKIVSKKVRELNKKNRNKKLLQQDKEINTDDFDEFIESDITWKEELLNTIKNIEASAFERLCQRLLRELGFENVIVTGKPNDGGIDGKGILRLGRILSFHVVFQAKRYKDTVSPNVIRDFRGSLSANVDKGLVITTGRFTREARKEAQRDGALPIDLIDGEELAERLKELELGVKVKMIEEITINNKWYNEL